MHKTNDFLLTSRQIILSLLAYSVFYKPQNMSLHNLMHMRYTEILNTPQLFVIATLNQT